MTIVVSIKEAKNRLTELAREVEAGQVVTVTRNGTPVFDIVPHQRSAGLDLEAGWAYLRSKGYTNSAVMIADDFDDPLPEDFLITPSAERE